MPLEEIVGSALSRLERHLGARPVLTALPDDLPLVSVDPTLLEQVLVNLVDNAIKHAPGAAPIEVSARATPGAVVIEVADRGPGIAPGEEEAIFQKFRRGSDAAASGVGLGLAICRGIIEAHGGTIRARRREGGGAVFSVVLPRPPGEPS